MLRASPAQTQQEHDLIKACHNKNENLTQVNMLINSEVSLRIGGVRSQIGHNGFTPLHYAAAWGHINIVRALLDKDKELVKIANTDSFEGITALLSAAQGNSSESAARRCNIVRYLVEDFAVDIFHSDAKNKNALSWAIHSEKTRKFDNQPIIDYLFSRIEHEFLEDHLNNIIEKNSFTRSDRQRTTLLHTAIEYKKYSLAKILIMAGASLEERDSLEIKTQNGTEIIQRTPFELAKAANATELCALILCHNINLYKPMLQQMVNRQVIIDIHYTIMTRSYAMQEPHVILASATSFGNGYSPSSEQRRLFENTYQNLYAKPSIAPLLKLAAMFVKSYHRPNQSQDDGLLIKIAHQDNNVNNITLDNIQNAWGVYTRGNIIYVANNNYPSLNIFYTRGTLLHELTHFIAEKVFNNNCKPYFENDAIAKQRFTEICNELKDSPDIAHTVKMVFDPTYYHSTQWHAEIIVKIPELIAEGKDDILQAACYQSLIEYYEQYFLEACKRYIKKLEYKNQILTNNNIQLVDNYPLQVSTLRLGNSDNFASITSRIGYFRAPTITIPPSEARGSGHRLNM